MLANLIGTAFAYMDGRIDPPSSVHRLTGEAIEAAAVTGEIWIAEIAAEPVACLFLSRKGDALYLGKLAVAEPWRGHGIARALVAKAAGRARDQGLVALELQTRVELVENHAAFRKLGFRQTGQTAHPGFDRPTSITMRLHLDQF
ncbi:MAG: GNAT family N-acetyltransferase [Rhodobacteraceae bacterium]|nr:GNAT family N-acetyltransferase [Paracoccaceae bacterium]